MIKKWLFLQHGIWLARNFTCVIVKRASTWRSFDFALGLGREVSVLWDVAAERRSAGKSRLGAEGPGVGTRPPARDRTVADRNGANVVTWYAVDPTPML